MKLVCLLVLCLGWSVALAAGQNPKGALGGLLVQCGKEKVAVVEGTASKDGHFAAGWTLRPKANKPPFNWSDYHRDDPAAFVKKFNPQDSVDFPQDGDYELVNGVLDLVAKTFTPLTDDAPYYPGEPYSGLSADWSDDRHGTHYGVVINVFGTNHSESTAGLWLVTLDAAGTHTADLKPDAGRAVASFLRKRDPKDAARYQWSFSSDNGASNGEPSMVVFKGGTLTLHFIAQIPEETRNIDAGYVSFTLPKGTVAATTSDEPFRRAVTR